MIKKTFFVVLLTALFFYSTNIFATDYSSLNFTVKDSVIKPGSGFSTSSNFQLWSSIGQEAIGLSTTTNFLLKSGFLYFPIPAGGATTTPGPVIIPIGMTGGDFIGEFASLLRKIPRMEGRLICDFNRDEKCDIVDFSIILTFYDKQTDSTTSVYDLNSDGRIYLIDLSILFYYWA